jgi:pyridoxal phosphate phosphatase PHOSPHO2
MSVSDAILSSQITTTAVIFDYDWSLINCNSDTYIFDQLWPERPTVVEEIYKDETKQWTKAVDRSLELLTQTKPDITPQHVLQCVARVPVQPCMLEAVQHAHDRNAKLFIVSDANTAFIDAFLKDQGMSDLFEMVISNKAIVREDRLVVQPYHDFDTLPAHGCPLCSPNMCKGQILEDVLGALKFDRIIYVGDGGGDYCPTTRMRQGSDTVLARNNFALAKKIATTPINAKLREWESGEDVLRIFKEIL